MEINFRVFVRVRFRQITGGRLAFQVSINTADRHCACFYGVWAYQRVKGSSTPDAYHGDYTAKWFRNAPEQQSERSKYWSLGAVVKLLQVSADRDW
jgi:hypothetical protein